MTAQSKNEFEIKLSGGAQDIARIRKWLVNAGAGRGNWHRLAYSYFDTPTGDLLRHGIHLQMCDASGRRRQCLRIVPKKRSTLPPLRSEAVLPISYAAERDGILDFDVLPANAQLQAILREHQTALTCRARLSVDRWAAIIEGQSAKLRVSTDDGTAERLNGAVVEGVCPIAEIRFAHLEGSPAPMFALARKAITASDGRLRLSVMSESERALKAGTIIFPGKAKKIILDTDGVASDALRMGLLASAVRMVAIAPSVHEMRMPEGARQLRIALRRFRSIERVFRRSAKSKEIRALAEQARDFARALGAARDWDVFLADTLPALEGEVSADGIDLIRKRAEALRAQAWDNAATEFRSREFSLFVFDLFKTAHLQTWRRRARLDLFDPVRDFAGSALDRRLAKAVTVGESLNYTEPEAGHPLRLQLKKLRYSAQIFRDLYPKEDRKPYFQAMSGLQDGFGALNDAVVAQRLAEEAADGQGAIAIRAAGFIVGYRGEEARRGLTGIVAGWQTFSQMDPYWRQSVADEDY